MNDAQQSTPNDHGPMPAPHQPPNYAEVKAEANGFSLAIAGSMFLLGLIPFLALWFSDAPESYALIFGPIWVLGIIVPSMLAWLGGRR